MNSLFVLLFVCAIRIGISDFFSKVRLVSMSCSETSGML
jgi:hypothetical protein